MGEISINPKHNVHKKYREVIYVNPFLATPPVVVPVANTFIGGVATTLYSAALLAAKLAIDVSRISAFEVVGSDIKCRITGNYVIPSSAFQSNLNITHYYDNHNLVTEIGGNSFSRCPLFTDYKLDGVLLIGSFCFEESIQNTISFPNLTVVNSYCFFNSKTKKFHIPRCTNLGGTVSNNNVFQGVALNDTLIYAHPSLQTNNSGVVDGDLVGFTVRYVTNFTAPNPITTLALGTIYNTAIQLNFTAPSSANAIDYYECYANGILKNRITESSQYVTGLTANTAYQFTVVAVDVFYNKSVVSNSVSVSTNNTSAVPLTGLVSYYKLESNSIDSHGTNNGVDTAVTYGVGKIVNGTVLNGASSYISLGNNANLQLSIGSISFWSKTSNAGASYRGLVVKQFAYGLFLSSGILVVYNWGTNAGERSTGINLNDNIWHHLVLVFDSGTANNNIYVDGVLRYTFSMAVSNQNTAATIGSGGGATQLINGSIDEVSIYNTKLTQSQISLIYNNGNGITL